MSLGDQLRDLPLTGLLVSLAKGIAQAQVELDTVSIQIAQMMSGVEPENRIRIGRRTYSLMELGLTPTFYHFVETTLEVKMAISMTIHGDASQESSESSKYAHMVKSVDAEFAGKYQYSVEGSSLVRTRMVPRPPPGVFQDHIDRLIEDDRKYRDQFA